MLNEQTEPTDNPLPRLLLVEDSKTSAALVTSALRDRYRVLHARDGVEAWDALSRNDAIDLIITDIQMPNMNGHDLLLKIRSSDAPETKALPVIVMTTADDTADRDRAFANGANDFIYKPVDVVELQARVAVHQKLATTIRELEASRRRLTEQAMTDALTKLKNRRAFTEVSAHHFMLAKRHNAELSLVAFDIDHFKRINDTHGHGGGDQALKAVARIITDTIRGSDIPARVGGEEFMILLPNTGRIGAGIIAERVRTAIERTPMRVGDVDVTVTLSGGVASLGADGSDFEQLIDIADKRLYLAKQKGRNRIVLRDAKASAEPEITNPD